MRGAKPVNRVFFPPLVAKGLTVMVRRILFGAFALLIAMAAPAAADHSYNHVLGTNDQRSPAAVTASDSGTAASATSADDSRLARTGSNIIVPLAQVATALLGGGALLVLATRRRRGRETSATA